jgi:DNA mismatch repair protein MutS
VSKLSPMLMQYKKLKQENRDCILFFRLGDFYEMFFEDAKIASEELDLTLTGRDCGLDERAPMCGVPHHSCEAYIARLIAKGYKVAICEQMEDPSKAKGLVTRDVVRIVSPGTVIEGSILEEDRNNYICSVYLSGTSAGLCFIDISTGEAFVVDASGENTEERIINELEKFSPREAVLNKSAAGSLSIPAFLRDKLNSHIETLGDEFFEESFAKSAVTSHFNADRISELGFSEDGACLNAAGALLSYLKETQKNDLSHINSIDFLRSEQFMILDTTARKNLEIFETLRNKEKKGSLLWVFNHTKTSSGGRLLRQWLEKPLIDVNKINKRLAAVSELKGAPIIRDEISEKLKCVRDMERLLGRIVYGVANARDLIAISQTVSVLPEIKDKLSGFGADVLKTAFNQLDTLTDIKELIDKAINETPPFSVREGDIIREGYSSEVDSLRDIMKNGKGYIASIEAAERERTGIKNLKIGYNRIFGYYIEVSKSNIPQAPAHYIRKQTLANCERYITEELKEKETLILGAQEKLAGIEYELFKNICDLISAESKRIRRTARIISLLDVLLCFADVAEKNRYCEPKVTQNDGIIIKNGRHPVVEKTLVDSLFVPNDTVLDCGDNRMVIITGPNMAGKSTYMRQIALIVLMAQIGSFVPAESAEIGVVDRIFTRIGASDDLASGQSTFMVEMSEVADIIKHATPKSLLILDEIGRGTSTFDGMSIARAVVEYAADKSKIGAKTLFATHYHELTDLEHDIEGVKNYNIAVKKRGFDITFLRKIVRGCADDSYGIEVGKLAGLPEPVIRRAKEILSDLEAGAGVPRTTDKYIRGPEKTNSAIIEELSKIDANTLSPLEALSVLHSLSLRARQAPEE